VPGSRRPDLSRRLRGTSVFDPDVVDPLPAQDPKAAEAPSPEPHNADGGTRTVQDVRSTARGGSQPVRRTSSATDNARPATNDTPRVVYDTSTVEDDTSSAADNVPRTGDDIPSDTVGASLAVDDMPSAEDDRFAVVDGTPRVAADEPRSTDRASRATGRARSSERGSRSSSAGGRSRPSERARGASGSSAEERDRIRAARARARGEEPPPPRWEEQNQRLTFWIPVALREDLYAEAARTDMKMSQVIVDALIAHLWDREGG